MNSIKYISSVIFLISAVLTFAQDPLPESQVEVVKAFDARLSDARKLNIPIELPQRDSALRLTQAAALGSYPIQLQYEAPKLRPLAMKPEADPTHYNGWFKAGYGFPNMALGEASWYYDSGNDFYLNFSARHHSAKDHDREWKRFSSTGGELEASYLSDNGMYLEGGFSYSQDDRYFYGFPESLDTFVSESEVMRRFKKLQAGLSIENYKRTASNIDYKFGFDFVRLTDNLATEESNTELFGKLRYWLADRHPFELEGGISFTQLNDTLDRTFNNVFIRPSFTYKADDFSILAGLRLEVHDDEFNLFPNVEGRYRVLGDRLIAVASAEGGFRKNNFLRLSSINPWITPRLDSLANTHYLRFSLGAEGKVDKLVYKAFLSFEKAESTPLMVNQAGDSLRFGLRYDDLDIFSFNASADWEVRDDLHLILQLRQSFYETMREDEAWHLPATHINAGALYEMLDNRLQLRGDLFIENGVHYLKAEGGSGKLDGLIDLSLSGEYKLNTQIGLFLEFNNILSDKRERWFRYETYGINILGGITAKF